MSRSRFLICVFAVGVLFMLIGNPAAYAQLNGDAIAKLFTWRDIGPVNTNGRVSDIEAVESNPKIIWVGYGHSGVWKSVNAGITWTPVFDGQPVASVGDLAIYQKNPDIVYVGTGEANNRQSSPWGAGVYKTTDGGKTWQFLGLKDTQHIGRIVIDPNNPNIVYVAAVGHLWGPNEERGLYKTTDGGKLWTRIYYVDNKTGATDVAMDPKNSNILYCSMYEREHDAFETGDPAKARGPGSGIFLTTDAGKTWTKAVKGLPPGDKGRISFGIARSKPGTLYAIIDAGGGGAGRGGAAAAAGADTAGGRGRAGAGAGVAGGGRAGAGAGQQPVQPPNPNTGGIFKSTDYGKSWTKVNDLDGRPPYFSQIAVDPQNENILWVANVSFSYSSDGGKTFSTRPKGSTHDDSHAWWIDPNDGNHVLVGTDGGLVITYDGGTSWDHIYQMPTVLFYQITADMRKPYYVHGGLQDNGSWAGPSNSRDRFGIRLENWFCTGGGDGFYSQVDQTDFNIVYRESQNGGISRMDLRTGQSASISPRAGNSPTTGNIINVTQYFPNAYQPAPQAAAGGAAAGAGGGRGGGGRGGGVSFTFDWNSPMLLSHHNNNILYFGGNYLFKSLNRGDRWMIISPDLTLRQEKNDNKPRAIVSIAESWLNPDLLYVGSNDGNLWMTRNGGVNWTKLNATITGAPNEVFVKRVEPSHHIEGRAYVVFDAHRSNDMKPYIFVTEDFGKTWTPINNNLPEGSVYVVREDYKNPNLLFCGTEFAAYFSIDRGKIWYRFMNGIPTVAFHDLYIHPRDGDLIAGTHGRGAWICDNITPLQQLTDSMMIQNAFLFEPRPEVRWLSTPEWSFSTDKEYRGKNPPTGSSITYYLKSQATEASLEISDITGERKFTQALTGDNLTPGLHSYVWRFNFGAGGGGGRGGAGGGAAGGGAAMVSFPATVTDQQRQQIITQAQTAISATEDQQRKQQIQTALTAFQNATGTGVLQAFTQLTQIIGGGAGGAAGGAGAFGGGRGGAGGNTAGPGEYLVKLTVDGKVLTRKLVVEADTPSYMGK